MKTADMKRLLELARECEVKGWDTLVRAHADLLLADGMGGGVSGASGEAAKERAAKLAAEARGYFRDAVKLLDEVAACGSGDVGL